MRITHIIIVFSLSLFLSLSLTHTCRNADTRPHKHTDARHLSIDWSLYIAPAQVLRAGGDSFTVLAGRPHSIAREDKIVR